MILYIIVMDLLIIKHDRLSLYDQIYYEFFHRKYYNFYRNDDIVYVTLPNSDMIYFRITEKMLILTTTMCIAIEIQFNLPNLIVWFSDISSIILDRYNRNLNVELSFINDNTFSYITTTFDDFFEKYM